MIISFAWTWEAVAARRKRCTRRDWSERYFQQWVVVRFYLLRLTTPATGQLVLPGLPATLTPRPGR